MTAAACRKFDAFSRARAPVPRSPRSAGRRPQARAGRGEATTKTHVAHILQKLRLRDRVQAVIYAYEHNLVRPGEGEAGPLGTT